MEPQPDVKSSSAAAARKWSDVHPKVGAALFAGYVTNLIIGLCQAKYGLDLSGFESDINGLVMILAAYAVPGAR